MIGGRKPGPHGMAMPKQKADKKTFKRLFSYLLAYKWRLVVVFVSILVTSLCTVASSVFLGTFLVGIIRSGDLTRLPVLILIMAGIYLFSILCSFLYNRLMVDISQGVLRDMRNGMFAHMQKLPLKYFDTHNHGELMSHFTNDTDTLRQMISQGLPQLISSAITILSVFIAMLIYSPALTLVVLLSILCILFCVKTLGTKSGKHFVEQQKAIGSINGYIEEMMHGQKVVKVFNHERLSEKEFDQRNESLRLSGTRANQIANAMFPIMGNMGHLQYIVLAVVGAGIVLFMENTSFSFVPSLLLGGTAGVLTLGNLISFLALSKQFTQPIGMLANQVNGMLMAMAGAGRIFALMDELAEEDEGYVTLVDAKEENGVLAESAVRTGLWAWKHPHEDGTTSYERLFGDVLFEDVTFGYRPEKTILHNISLYAKPGQKIAFVGATGAGKTTITNLINRFYTINSGKIRYDGINIEKMKKEDLRRSLGVVLQDVHLFTDTVMENIRYGRLEATDEECIAAAKLAHADTFITMLKDGYQTVLSGDGSGLSQGQRQLISIARAAVADPPVMILDEATSSIDTRTEAIVQRGMDALMQGRTVFVIAHRLSTVRNADAILVLEKGNIIERGSHDELIALKGKYHQLYTGAFELA